MNSCIESWNNFFSFFSFRCFSFSALTRSDDKKNWDALCNEFKIPFKEKKNDFEQLIGKCESNLRCKTITGFYLYLSLFQTNLFSVDVWGSLHVFCNRLNLFFVHRHHMHDSVLNYWSIGAFRFYALMLTKCKLDQLLITIWYIFKCSFWSKVLHL